MDWHVCREAFEPSAYANIWYKIGRLHDYWSILHRRYHEIVFAAKVACMKSVNIGPLCKPCIIEWPGNAGNIAGRKMRCWNSMLQGLRMAAARKAAHSIRLENRRRLLPNRYIHPSGVAICIEESKKNPSETLLAYSLLVVKIVTFDLCWAMSRNQVSEIHWW